MSISDWVCMCGIKERNEQIAYLGLHDKILSAP